MYEEPEERYHDAQGQLPCRVCRSPLQWQDASEAFSPDVATQVAEPPSEVIRQRRMAASQKTGPVMGGAAGGDGGFAGDGEKTTVLDVAGAQRAAAAAPAHHGYAAPTQALSPQSPPAAARPNVHNDPTHIFEMPRPANPPPPMYPPEPSQPAPTALEDAQASARRQVVIGGAAGSGSTEASLKTQAFDVKVIQDETHQQKTNPTGIPQSLIVPAGAAPIPQHPAHVPASYAAGPAAMPSTPSSKGRALVIGLAAALLVAVVILALALAGVFSASDSDSSETSAAGASTTEGRPPPVRADRLLRRLRGDIEPPLTFSGGSASQPGYVVGVDSDPLAGAATYWVGGEDGPRQVADLAALVDSVPSANAPVFTLFDRALPLPSVVATMDALRAAQRTPYLAAGSTLGEDVFYGFAANGQPDASTVLQLGQRGIVFSHAGWSEPRQLCYTPPILPTEQLVGILDEAFGSAPEADLRVEITSDLDLQHLVNLAAGIRRDGLRMHFSLAAGPVAQTECGPQP